MASPEGTPIWCELTTPDADCAESMCGWCKDRWGFPWQIVRRALIAGMSTPIAPPLSG